MNLIDMHCDTLWKFMEEKESQNLMQNEYGISIEKLKKAGATAQFFACFIYMSKFEGNDRYEQGYAHALQMLARLKSEAARDSDEIAIAYNYTDYERNLKAGKISVFATIEEGGIIHNDGGKIQALYRVIKEVL